MVNVILDRKKVHLINIKIILTKVDQKNVVSKICAKNITERSIVFTVLRKEKKDGLKTRHRDT